VPFMWADVSANVVTDPATVRRSSSVNGLGDIVLMPLMLNYNVSSNLNVNFRTGIYAPPAITRWGAWLTRARISGPSSQRWA